MKLWNNWPDECLEMPEITPYVPENKRSNAAVVIFPGGGYGGRAAHEGKGYAEFLAENGITAFVVDYRVSPNRYPVELLDARRAVCWVRAHAEEYGLDKNQIAVMGSSAGGHLAALLSTSRAELTQDMHDEIDKEDYRPNAQILCYPVVLRPETGVAHCGSYFNLIGREDAQMEAALDPSLLAGEDTPQAFIWHTANDDCVNVINSYAYATALRKLNINVEMHIFPKGCHGLGLAAGAPHVAQWSGLLINWFKYIGYLN